MYTVEAGKILLPAIVCYGAEPTGHELSHFAQKFVNHS
jgi:hypothetical protein